jgi:hypothetical protein
MRTHSLHSNVSRATRQDLFAGKFKNRRLVARPTEQPKKIRAPGQKGRRPCKKFQGESLKN